MRVGRSGIMDMTGGWLASLRPFDDISGSESARSAAWPEVTNYLMIAKSCPVSISVGGCEHALALMCVSLDRSASVVNHPTDSDATSAKTTNPGYQRYPHSPKATTRPCD